MQLAWELFIHHSPYKKWPKYFVVADEMACYEFKDFTTEIRLFCWIEMSEPVADEKDLKRKIILCTEDILNQGALHKTLNSKKIVLTVLCSFQFEKETSYIIPFPLKVSYLILKTNMIVT